MGRLRAARAARRPAGARRSGSRTWWSVRSWARRLMLPKAAVVLVVLVAVIWIPLRGRSSGCRSTPSAAIGWPHSGAASPVNRTKVVVVHDHRPVRGVRRACRSRPARASGHRFPSRPTSLISDRAPSSSAGSASPAESAASSARWWRWSCSSSIRDDMTFMRVDPNFATRRPGPHPDRRAHGRQLHSHAEESRVTATSGEMQLAAGRRATLRSSSATTH